MRLLGGPSAATLILTTASPFPPLAHPTHGAGHGAILKYLFGFRDPATLVAKGDSVVIKVTDTERTEHLQGDSKPVTIHRALGGFIRAL